MKQASLRLRAASHQRPAGQGKQVVPLDTVGPTQEAHVEAFKAYNGDMQVLQVIEPASDTVPARQGLQEFSDDAPEDAENDPEGHGAQEKVPIKRYEPAGQAKGEDEEVDDGVHVDVIV